jgi:raffinose/stachyose/melibiose transport system permease protein
MTKQGISQHKYLLYTIPAIILVSITIYVPFVMSGYYSLTEWNGIAKDATFIGLGNYANLINDADFFQSFIFTAKYSVAFIIISNVFALALAVALVQKIKTANILRSVFFVPYIMSMTIVGFIWKFIFSQGFAKLYEITSWEFLQLSWLGDPNLAGYSVTLVGIWQSLGFYIVLYIAGLQAVPPGILEAARIDGANGIKRFFNVTLPLLGPSITTCVFMALTNSLKVFDIILALTKGGPGSSTYSVTLNIYREAFQNNNYGMGSAKSVIFFAIVLLLTQVVLKLFSRREVEY